ncbi:MAG: toxic anion resistance protein [Candidatus Limnocylindrales bacterium]|jgi:uncharacterized protein YaaN involved in tellurite resistance
MGDSLKLDKVSGSAVASGVVAAGRAATSETAALVLTAPAPVAEIAGPAAQDAVTLDAETVKKLDEMVSGYVDAIATLDVHDPKFETRVADIRNLGEDDIKASAQVSSRLLDRPVAALKRGGISGSSVVSNSLIQLRRQIDDLDPAHQGDLFSPRKLLGIIPWGDKLRDYFDRYRSSQNHINAVIKGLGNGQATLQKDNADLEQEKANLWAIMERLRQYIYLAQKLDASLTARIAQIEKTDPERAKVLQEDMLFYVRQKVQDLTTQLAVSVQGYLALDVIRRNNLELIRGVDRATTTTVSALRTAVIVAQALSDQKLVLDQITALNTTTSNLIESTSVLLRQQSATINEQAASATVDIAKLQTAFDNIYATMDEIDAFKLKALDNMSQTVDALTAQIGKAQAYLDRAKTRHETAAGESGLELPK